jgi:hypothetical protein
MIVHWGRVLALAFAFGWGAAPLQGSPPAQEESGTHTIAPGKLNANDAPDSTRTRAAIEEVLARSEFADLQADPYAGWRKIFAWLKSLFRRVGSAMEHWPHWVMWIIVAWMFLTLLAILAHLIYTLAQLLGGSFRTSDAGSRVHRHQGELLGIRELNFETVYAEACRLLTVGDWPAATRYYYVSAILWLDRQGAIAFRPSKTNRDYIRELQALSKFQNPFGRLTNCFESIIYAGQPATAFTSRNMADIVEGLFHEPAPN